MDKDKLIKAIESKLNAYQDMMDRDYLGGLHSLNDLVRELKYWKEAIERGEFDSKN